MWAMNRMTDAMSTDAIGVVFLSDDDRWAAIQTRDPQADQQFWYGVKTTGVYCRPTCASRLPKRENVVFFATGAAAEQAGFRACKRCQPATIAPQHQQTTTIAMVCQLIETSDHPPSLATLAAAAHLSPYHLHRLFKQVTGITPKQYATAHRLQRLRHQLPHTDSITEAIYNAGFNTSSSFYQEATHLLGMTPTDYKRGAIGLTIQFAVCPCYLGYVLVAKTERGICTIAFGDSPDHLTAQLQQRFPHAQVVAADGVLDWMGQVLAFIETPQQGLALPLDIQGTAFQQRVWQAVQTIPPGSTASYAQVATAIGNPKAVRAVARAIASNQLAVAIPCHRVIGSRGALTGYRWGMERKQALLTRELE